MQVDSTPPFTSIAQAMGQAAQAPPPPGADGDNDADGARPAGQASTPSGVGASVDVTV
jgi:hypothetical protein